MRFVALAAGFDGTLAREGRYDERCVEALRALAATGRKLILVTARELRELLELFPATRIFDFVIAENGAVLHQPAAKRSEILANAPSEILLQELNRRGVHPLSIGSSIITTSRTNEAEVRDVLAKHRLDMQLIGHDSALIISPSEVSKASGVKEALRQLGISAHNLVVIGDSDNDLALFELAEHSVAVSNANDDVRAQADRTTNGAYCDGFLELARDLIASDLIDAPPRVQLTVGELEGGGELSLAPYFDSLLVCGPRGSGKAAFCRRLVDALQTDDYQCCVVGAGTDELLAPRHGARTFGDECEAPRLSDIMSALEQPTTSVVLNLRGLPAESRSVFVEALLVQLQALHDRVGRPHAIVLQEAQWLLSGTSGAAPARLSEMTRVYMSSEPERLPTDVLESVKSVITVGTPPSSPEEFMHVGAAVRLELKEPFDLGPSSRAARSWVRHDSRFRPSFLQAMADDAGCDGTSRPREGSTTPASEGELSSVSG